MKAPASGAVPDGGSGERDLDQQGVLQPVAAPPKQVTHVEATPRPREMDQEVLEAIQSGLADLRRDLARDYGVALRHLKLSYTKWNSRIGFEVATVREDGVVMDGLAEAFIERCRDYDLAPGDLGRPFSDGERLFRITGLRPRANQPILCEQIDPEPTRPTEFRFKPSAVRHYLHECTKQPSFGHRH